MTTKRILFLFITFCLLPFTAYTQNDFTIEYYDSEWNLVANKEEASFYREIKYNDQRDPVGIVKDYYITGELQWRGKLIRVNSDSLIIDGKATYFYKNGNKKVVAHYNYGKENGIVTTYRTSGKLKEKRIYKKGDLLFSTEYYRSGNIEFIAEFNEDGNLIDNVYTECDELGNCEEIFFDSFKNNENNWPIYDNDKVLTRIENGKYLINLYSKAGLYLTTYKEINQINDYSIKIRGKFNSTEKNSVWGIGFGFKNYDSNYSFLISKNGRYSVHAKIDGSHYKLIEWNSTDKISPEGYNELKVATAGDQIGYHINGSLVDVTDDFALESYGFGPVLVNNKGEASFTIDEFILKNEVENINPNWTALRDKKVKKEDKNIWTGAGSGILVSSKGFVITNYHVVKGAKEIQLKFSKNVKLSANIAAKDEKNDLAILKVNTDKLKYADEIPFKIKLDESKVGAKVFTLGYPFSLSGLGEEVKFTNGNISSRSGYEGDITLYQISVPIQPGNSGGPLFDLNGNLIGITNAKITEVELQQKSRQWIKVDQAATGCCVK